MGTDPQPQPVLIPPDNVGRLHALRRTPNGSLEALVSWVENITGDFRGGLVDHPPQWWPIERIRRMQGVDYTELEQLTRQPGQPAPQRGTEPLTADTDTAPHPVPHGWPPSVLPPDQPDWVKSAVAWLLDILPPDYRRHDILRERPRLLAWMVALHVPLYHKTARHGFANAAVDLREHLPPEAIQATLEVYRQEITRLETLGVQVRLIRRALAEQLPP